MSKDMFGLFDMIGTYKERKVSNYKDKKIGLIVDTARVTDSEKDYETGIVHPLYNSGKWVIVELYDTKKEAKKGHKKWVKLMTATELPKELVDVSTCEIAKFRDAMQGGKDWRKKDGKNEK